MENDRSSSDAQTFQAQAERALHTLDADRALLADRVAAPRWFYPVLAIVAAGFVARPAAPSELVGNVVGGALVGVYIALLMSYSWGSQIRVGRSRPRAVMILIGLIGALVAVQIVSVVLVNLLSPWWVLAPSIVCLTVTLGVGLWFDRAYQDMVRRGQ